MILMPQHDWTGDGNSIYRTLGASSHTDKEREAFDYYATEPKAVELLLKEETFSPVVWECACGEGHLSKVLESHGYQVISTDLIYRGYGDPNPLDFLKETLEGFDGDIITNPPYKYALDFVKRALDSVQHKKKGCHVPETAILGRAGTAGVFQAKSPAQDIRFIFPAEMRQERSL